MATYAAYRHVELDKVGCGKRSIMKPPGGESHDIFGSDFVGAPSHHRVLKPPGGGTSGLFATTSEEDQKPRLPQTDSPSPQNSSPNLSNGVDLVNGKTGKLVPDNCMSLEEKDSCDLDAISIPSSVISAEIKTLSAQIQKRQHYGNPLTGDGFQKVENSSTRVFRQRDGNPLTGEGCQSSEHYVIRVHRQRDGNPVTGEGYDTQDNRHGGAAAPPTRTRIPPGGYSSGLW